MLTTMFYYGHYKPYLIKDSNISSNEARKKPKIASSDQAQANPNIFLNKAFKYDIVKYAKDVKTNVLDTRETSNNVVKSMDNFNKTSYYEGQQTASKMLEDELVSFVSAYNNSITFFGDQKHSAKLEALANTLEEETFLSSESLKNLGLSLDGDVLSFDASTLKKQDQSAINVSIGENIGFFYSVSERFKTALQTPLMEHMQFKGLGYYYNYKVGSVKSDTFKIIETGMLVDKAV